MIRKRGERNIIDGSIPLHELHKLLQLKYVKEQTEEILAHLDDLIRATRASVPVRELDFSLDRKSGRIPSGAESLLERAIWKKWKSRDREPFLASVCDFVQTYQMPLAATEGDGCRFAVDLVGVSPSRIPVVIELKAGITNASETPLRMLVEAAAYGIAIQKCWSSVPSPFKEQWRTHVGIEKEEQSLNCIPLICIAPETYWQQRKGRDGVRSEGKIPEAAWRPLKELVQAFRERGFPAEFMQFHECLKDQNGLPEILNLQMVDFPEMRMPRLEVEGFRIPQHFYAVSDSPALLAGMKDPCSIRPNWRRIEKAGFRHVVCLNSAKPAYDPAPLRIAHAVELQDLVSGDPPEDPEREERLIRTAVAKVVRLIKSGEGVVVHCLGGRGRTGTVLGCILRQLGYSGEDTIEYLDAIHKKRGRSGWPESAWQADLVLRFR